MRLSILFAATISLSTYSNICNNQHEKRTKYLVLAEQSTKVDEDYRSSRNVPAGACRSQFELKFTKEPPVWKAMSKPLSSCREFSHNTCCKKAHTDIIKKKNLLTAAAKFNAKCRDFHQKYNCMPCHGDVGIKSITRVCKSLCDAWYGACIDEYYTHSSTGKLQPCTSNSVFCTKLEFIAKSGVELCTRMSLVVATTEDNLNDEQYFSENLDECYDGSPPKTYKKREKEVEGYDPNRNWRDKKRNSFMAPLYLSFVRWFDKYRSALFSVIVGLLFTTVFAVFIPFLVEKLRK